MVSPMPSCSKIDKAVDEATVPLVPMPASVKTLIQKHWEANIKDANGNPLADGDAVILVKDLKVKGSSTTLKMGTKVKSIRLVGGDHEVDCKMDVGNYMLKACFLRKA